MFLDQTGWKTDWDSIFLLANSRHTCMHYKDPHFFEKKFALRHLAFIKDYIVPVFHWAKEFKEDFHFCGVKKEVFFHFHQKWKENRVQHLFCGEVLWRQCIIWSSERGTTNLSSPGTTLLRISPSSLHSIDLHPWTSIFISIYFLHLLARCVIAFSVFIPFLAYERFHRNTLLLNGRKDFSSL